MINEHTEPSNKAAPPAPTPAPNASKDDGREVFAAHKPKRTLGLKLFDDFAYGTLNTVVFFASFVMTYWTKHGHTFGQEGSLARKIGSGFHSRSKPINEFWGKLGVKSEKLRSDYTSVLWSFLDGTIFSFLAKPFEDRREKIAKKIDAVLGTSPENLKVYEAEPKQSWLSVVGGRALTFLVVFPTAKILGTLGGNEWAFLAPGRKLAKNIDQLLPRVSRWLERQTIRTPEQKGDLFGYVFFEFFYTGLCTTGLYFFSRFFARRHPAKEKHLETHPHPTAHADEAPDQPMESKPAIASVASPVAQVEAPGKSDGRIAANAQSVLQTA